jgi:hypothetical protein
MKVLNDIVCNLNLILIQSKRNEIQIGVKGIENLFMITMLKKKTSKRYRSLKTPSIPLT